MRTVVAQCTTLYHGTNLEHVEVRMTEFARLARSERPGRAGASLTSDEQYPTRTDARQRMVAERPVDDEGSDEGSRLAAAIRAGDESAFDRLFRRHVTGLIRYASRIVTSDAVAQDIVMDVFTRLWRDRASLAPDTRLAAYLKRGVRNASIDHLRHDRLVASIEDISARSGWAPGMGAAGRTPDQELERSEAKEIVRRAFMTLPKRMRLVLELRWLGEKSYKEIANELGLQVKSVETVLGRAMRLLRERMGREAGR